MTISTIGSLLPERRTELVRYDDVQIEMVFEGNGPAVVLLPSLARDFDDYDEVAEGLAAGGFRVLRPRQTSTEARL